MKILLKTHGIAPKKTLGQHFLISRSPLLRLLEAADLTKEDLVLEIGPGLGVLTRELAQRAKRVVAVEKDTKLASILKEQFQDTRTVEIREEDILKVNLAELSFPQLSSAKLERHKVVANLPFAITGPVLRKFLEADNPPSSITLLIQKEVAKRICAQPPRMNLLALSVQLYAHPRIITNVKKEAFWPKPGVDSAIIHIVPKALGSDIRSLIPTFFLLAKAGFSQPRKQLVNNLSKKLGRNKEEITYLLRAVGIRAEQRAETVSVEEWIALARYYTMQ